MMALDNALQFDLPAECDKAAKILQGFLHTHADTDVGKRRLNVIPPEVIQRAKGLAIFTVLKGEYEEFDCGLGCD